MPSRQKVILLGATGSIGSSTLDILRTYPDKFELVAISYHSNQDQAEQICKEFSCQKFCSSAPSFKWQQLVDCDFDIAIQAIVGGAGLEPSMLLAQTGRTILLANKESLVVAGELFNSAAQKHQTKVYPVDSEHNSLYRLLENKEQIARLILTASGGPLRSFSAEAVKKATLNQVLAHPTWSMGAKITVDSAGLINKALEIIEAHFLFALPYNQIEAVIHPQSLVHAAVQAPDGTLRLHVSEPDMRIPIAHALFAPAAPPEIVQPSSLAQMKDFTFEEIDKAKFPGFALGLQAGDAGGAMPMIFNAANEAANDAFRAGKISFGGIAGFIADSLDAHSADQPASDFNELYIRNEQYMTKFREKINAEYA